jgi:hypothetical protein
MCRAYCTSWPGVKRDVRNLLHVRAEHSRLDVKAAQDALAESNERIPYAAVRKKLGLDDEQQAKRPPAKARATKV